MPQIPITVKASLLISFTACCVALYCQFKNQIFVEAQLRHGVLLQQLNSGSGSILDKTQALLGNPMGLGSLKSLHDNNIVLYQSIVHGNLKQELASVNQLTGQDTEALETSFRHFSNLVSRLIQSRAQLLQLENNRDEAKIGARVLAEKGAELAIGIRQFGAATDQTLSAYDLALKLNAHYLSVIEIFTGSGNYKPLNISSLSATLNDLSSGPNATSSAILRRSAAQLQSDIASYRENADQIVEYQTLKQNIKQQIESIEQAIPALSQDVTAVQDALMSSSSIAFPASIGAWLCCLVTAIFGCLQTSRQLILSANPAPSSLPEPASELTSSYYLNQIKTDKNKLMSDIRPLADGILYLRADEHLESTGDIARCFNQSRESLIERIESLRALVTDLKSELDKKPAVEENPQANVKINTTPIEDLTFRAQSELEGILRKIRSQTESSSLSQQDVYTRCQRADRILDEIRVRVRKGFQETLINVVDELSSTSGSGQNIAVSKLITNLVSNLDELQTQAPTKARRRTK